MTLDARPLHASGAAERQRDAATASTRQGVFTSDDGIRLSYCRWGAESADVPVVLHHGFAASTGLNWVMTGVVAALQQAGRAVISIDARGHGQSDKPHHPSFYGEARMARDLAALLTELEVASFDLFGYSMGAVVSLLLAVDDTRVRRLVIGGVGEGVLACGGVDLRVMQRDALIEALLEEDATRLGDTEVARFRQFAEYAGADLKALAAQASRMHDTAIPLSRINVPTLVIAGTDDVLATAIEALANALPNAIAAHAPGDHLGAVRQPAFIATASRFLARP